LKRGDQLNQDFTIRSMILDMRERLEIGRWLDSCKTSTVRYILHAVVNSNYLCRGGASVSGSLKSCR